MRCVVIPLSGPILAILVLAFAPAAYAAPAVGSDQLGTVTLTIWSVTVDPRTGIATVTGEASCEPNPDPNTIVEVSDTDVFVVSRTAQSSVVRAEPCEPFSVELVSLGEPFKPGRLLVDATVAVTAGSPDRNPTMRFVVVQAETVARATRRA